MRKPEDICLICNERKATATNSHYTPAWMLATTIGSRDKEEAISIDLTNADVSVHYGRGNLSNTNTVPTQNPHAADYIFCQECEAALGSLENKFKPLLSEKIQEGRFKPSFKVKEICTDAILFEWNGDASGFFAFLLSLIWRVSLRVKLEEQVDIFTEEVFEKLRKQLDSLLYNKTTVGNSVLLGFTFLTHKISNAGSNGNQIIPFHKKLNPEVFWLNDFIVLAHLNNSENTDSKTFNDATKIDEKVLDISFFK